MSTVWAPKTGPFDVITMGRSGIDLYPLQVGVGLEDVETFGKFLGGSPMNVAVAAARYQNRSAIITGVGADPFGNFVETEMERLGVSSAFVVTNPKFNTPIAFCEIFPPDNFPLYFYRQPSTPDLELTIADVPLREVEEAKIFWISLTGLSSKPSCDAHLATLNARKNLLGSPDHWTIIDLDYRDTFWPSSNEARKQIQRVLSQVDVAIGNIEESRVAVGETDPDRAADALLEAGVKIAVIKQGPAGTLAKTRDERVLVPATPVQVCNGLGAGDAFGGAFCHALLRNWSLGESVQFASTAGAIVASKLECSTAMPTEDEVSELIAQNPASAPVIEHRRTSTK